MENNIIKKAVQQRNITRQQQIELAKNGWKLEAEKLAYEKNELGYKEFSWEAFLEVVPDEFMDTTKQSQIISLQDKYKILKELEDFIWAEDRVVAEFNKTHAVVHVDQTYILTEKNNALGRQDFSLESRLSFKAYYEDESIICIDNKERTKPDIWLKSPKRRKFKGVTFDPTTTEYINDQYNIWKGFSRKPIKGICEKYWSHVKENICSGNEESYRFVRKWLACIFQRPDIVHTAIVLCGLQGVGKNSFVDPLGLLMGAHYAPLSNISELVSNFNYHLKHAVLIHANEALWGGNKKEIGTVKSMVTEDICLIEGKGRDRIILRNFKHLILSSNEEWPVHLDPDDRRFFVLKVSDKRKEDGKYFKEIKDELNNCGYEALLYDLLNEDITDFDPTKLPTTSDSFNIKMLSSDSIHRYLFEALFEGGFSIGNLSDDELPVWQSPISKKMVFKDYCDWSKQNGETHKSDGVFGTALKKIIKSAKDCRPVINKKRARCYEFPSLEKAREEFCEYFKDKPERIFNDPEE